MVELPKKEIKVLAAGKFEISGDLHRVVTLLNKTLKKRDLIFGLTRDIEGLYELKIYEVSGKDDDLNE